MHEHGDPAETAPTHPSEVEAQLPLGVGDSVRCRYRGGVRVFPAKVIAVNWSPGNDSSLPLSYNVRYTADGVIEHDVPRSHIKITQKKFTASLVTSPYSKVRVAALNKI